MPAQESDAGNGIYKHRKYEKREAKAGTYWDGKESVSNCLAPQTSLPFTHLALVMEYPRGDGEGKEAQPARGETEWLVLLASWGREDGERVLTLDVILVPDSICPAYYRHFRPATRERRRAGRKAKRTPRKPSHSAKPALLDV